VRTLARSAFPFGRPRKVCRAKLTDWAAHTFGQVQHDRNEEGQRDDAIEFILVNAGKNAARMPAARCNPAGKPSAEGEQRRILMSLDSARRSIERGRPRFGIPEIIEFIRIQFASTMPSNLRCSSTTGLGQQPIAG